MLTPLASHCDFLCRILNGKKWPEISAETAEWLHIAASVIHVDIDITQHDDGFGWCSAADEHNLSREELLESCVTNLTIFNFIWGACESLIDTLKPPKNPDKSKRGKISDACLYLKNGYGKRPLLVGFVDELALFKTIAKTCLGSQVDNRFRQGSRFEIAGVGLFAVYELRNKFAHGRMKFPHPDDENRPTSYQPELIQRASRIVLLSIQMLLLAYYRETDEHIYMGTWLGEDCDDAYPLWVTLRRCHLTTGWPYHISEHERQLSLNLHS